MTRLGVRIATALALAALIAVALAPAIASAAPSPQKNKNVATVDLTLENQTVVAIWVNAIGSDKGGGAPAHVISGIDARVFKAVSYQVGEDPTTYYTRFPASPSFDVVSCSHESSDGLVTLTGVFIP